ncbi:Nicotianamine synthase [Karstenula rhodostoma CBS 690.94]|uniref:Nicotianamine synthase n=1 Tax=Karstenula rhodostoma CBS 690.94 TaxID=1392251 RepID=A0A9P4P9G5_9PLEO|nr:Nicotianamine synthase [Karstenula rhodostoma CBS 690.94]
MDQQVARGKHGHTRVDTPVSTPPPTPTPATAAAQDLYREIKTIYQQLAPLPSLAPCDLVNALLTRLVTICIQPCSPDVVDHFHRLDAAATLCHNLQNLCAIAEGELERHWAHKTLQDAGPHPNPLRTRTLLATFPYHANYLSLSHLEASLLTPFLTHPPSTIAFIGSGPLPLTSLCLLAHFPTATITNIDRDADALAVSSALTEKLGYADRMTFACEDAADASGGRTDWEAFDVVFLAALVGMRSPEKVGVLRGLRGRLRVGTVVVCRSARGMRGVLYPVLELSEELQGAGFEVLAELHPWNGVVNSVVVLRVKA